MLGLDDSDKKALMELIIHLNACKKKDADFDNAIDILLSELDQIITDDMFEVLNLLLWGDKAQITGAIETYATAGCRKPVNVTEKAWEREQLNAFATGFEKEYIHPPGLFLTALLYTTIIAAETDEKVIRFTFLDWITKYAETEIREYPDGL